MSGTQGVVTQSPEPGLGDRTKKETENSQLKNQEQINTYRESYLKLHISI